VASAFLLVEGVARAPAAAVIGDGTRWVALFSDLVRYAHLACWPQPLVFDYPAVDAIRMAGFWPTGALAVVLLATTAVALVRWPVPGFAGAWFIATLAPGLVVAWLAGAAFSEHRAYLAVMAIAGLATSVPVMIAGRRGLAFALVLAAGAGAVSRKRVEDYRSALAIWSDTVAKAPENSRASLYLGDALLASGRPEDAIAEYETAVRLRPEVTAARVNLAGALLQAGRAGEAVVRYQEALRLEPRAAEIHAKLAAALVRVDRREEAAAHFASAGELGMGAAEVRLRFGRALAEAGNLDEALPRLQEALRRRPDDVGTHIVLGMVLAATGREDDALSHFFSAVKLRPDDPAAHVALGDALYESFRPAQARPHFETALRLDPARAGVLHVRLGDTLSLLGRPDEAVRHYEAALAIDPWDAEGRGNLARIRAAVERRAGQK